MIEDRFLHASEPAHAIEAVSSLIGRFDDAARVCNQSAGQVVELGEASQIVHVVAGAAKLVAHVSQSRAQVVSFHFAGDIVAVPARGVHDYSLIALERLAVHAMAQTEFLALARCDAGLMEELVTRLLLSLGRCREKSIALGRKNATERLAGFLASMAERIGHPDDHGCAIDLPMSRRDIADSLGLTVETVSRQFGELKASGLVETIGRSGVRLFDVAALIACAGHLESAG